jgi:hypothetical protein
VEPSFRFTSKSSFVLASRSLISWMDIPYQRSVQQNNCLWDTNVTIIRKWQSNENKVTLPRYVPVELDKQVMNSLCNERLDTRLQAKPLELNVDQLVAGHDRLTLLCPFWVSQRTTTSLFWVEQLWIFLRLIILGIDLVISNINHNDYTLLEI